jgi:putative MATE family efflux protein
MIETIVRNNIVQSHDLTTGPLHSHFKNLAVPAAIGMVFSTLYNVVDVFYAGMLSTEAQAGLAISFQVFFVLLALGFGTGSAMGALVGNALGRNDDDSTKILSAQGITFSVIITIILFVAGRWFTPIALTWVSEAGAYRDAGSAYIGILLFALPAFILTFGLNGILQAQGDTKSMQYAQMAAFVANVILNPIFIFGIPNVVGGIGFSGIALSTLCAQSGVAIFICYRVFKSKAMEGVKPSDFYPQLGRLKEILTQALPVSFTMIVMMITGFVIQIYLKSYGQEAVAAYGVALRVEQLLLLPVFGLTGALLPIAAQNFGAGNGERVREAIFLCWKMGGVMMMVSAGVLFLGAESAMRVFSDDDEVVRIGVSYLHVDAFVLPLYMMLFAVNSVLQALKKPIWTLVIGIYRQAFAVAFFSYIFAIYFGLGIFGVWLGIATAVATGLLISLYILQRVSKPLIGGIWR